MRKPASFGSSAGIGTSNRMKRNQPASIQPQASAVAATPPNEAPARDLQEVIAPETAPPLGEDAGMAGFLRQTKGQTSGLTLFRL